MKISKLKIKKTIDAFSFLVFNSDFSVLILKLKIGRQASWDYSIAFGE
jgi:hypothetical protein